MIEGQATVIVESAIVALLVAPASLLALIGVPTWLGLSLSEATIGRLTRVLMTLAFLAGALALATHVLSGAEPWTASLGTWLETGVKLDFMVDTVSLSFATLAVALGRVAVDRKGPEAPHHGGIHDDRADTDVFEAITADTVEVDTVETDVAAAGAALGSGAAEEPRAES